MSMQAVNETSTPKAIQQEAAQSEGVLSRTDAWLERFADTRAFTILYITFLIVFVGFVSNAFFFDLSLRLDEAQSLWQTAVSPTALINQLSTNVHVPLYHLILHFWQVFFGNAVATGRLLSFIFFAASIPAFYALSKLAYSRSTALFSTTLFAISPFMIWYGSEIRMYSLFSLLIIANYYFFIRIFKKPGSWNWVGYTFTALLGIYTHYFFFLGLLAQVVFYFTNRRIFPEGSLRKFIWVAGFLLIAFAPWIFTVVGAPGGIAEKSPDLAPPAAIDVFNTFSQFLFGFQSDGLNAALVALWPLTILFVFLGLRKNRRISRESIFFITAVIIPMAAAFLLSIVIQPLFLSRYLILTLPPLFLFLGWIVSVYPSRLGAVLKTAFVILVLSTLGVQIYSTSVPVKEDYREAARYISENINPQDIVVLSAPFTVYPFEYYYSGPTSIETIPQWNRLAGEELPPFSREQLPQAVENISGSYENLWLLLSYDQGYEQEVRMYFDNNFERLLVRNISPGIDLYVYRLRYDI